MLGVLRALGGRGVLAQIFPAAGGKLFRRHGRLKPGLPALFYLPSGFPLSLKVLVPCLKLRTLHRIGAPEYLRLAVRGNARIELVEGFCIGHGYLPSNTAQTVSACSLRLSRLGRWISTCICLAKCA